MTGLMAVRALWRRLTPEALRRRTGPAVLAAVKAYVAARLPPADAPLAVGPIRVVGAYAGSHGIAMAAEFTARALESLGAAVERIAVGEGFDPGARLAGPIRAAAWIVYLNAPEAPLAMFNLGPERMIGPRYGAWAWELPTAPRSWLRDARLFTEVWTPSRYTADSLAGAAAPLRVVPHPIFLEDYDRVEPAPRTHAFQAVTLFDVKSSAARKNPMGAIAAFARAFGDDPTARLTVKAQSGHAYPGLIESLRAAAPPNVEIIDAVWPYRKVISLIAGADVLISLHRAEGFGMTMAEAMALRTPVVGTAHSGNLDFMDETCAMMVPARLIPVADPQGAYVGQTWGDPDVGAAAAALALLRIDAARARGIAAAGRARIEARLTPAPWSRNLPATLQAVIARGR